MGSAVSVARCANDEAPGSPDQAEAPVAEGQDAPQASSSAGQAEVRAYRIDQTLLLHLLWSVMCYCLRSDTLPPHPISLPALAVPRLPTMVLEVHLLNAVPMSDSRAGQEKAHHPLAAGCSSHGPKPCTEG